MIKLVRCKTFHNLLKIAPETNALWWRRRCEKEISTIAAACKCRWKHTYRCFACKATQNVYTHNFSRIKFVTYHIIFAYNHFNLSLSQFQNWKNGNFVYDAEENRLWCCCCALFEFATGCICIGHDVISGRIYANNLVQIQPCHVNDEKGK